MLNLKKTLEEHKKWLEDSDTGTRADLRRVNLKGADLTGADLTGADLTGADLRRVNLKGADLKGANLRDANLKGADLTGADLTGADLSYADLSYANLSYANLTGADLTGANLRDANLTGADLGGANLRGAYLTDANITDTIFSDFQIPQDTDLIGWGKKNETIVKLLIPKEAKRTGTPLGKKCRAEFVKVLKVYNEEKQVTSTKYNRFGLEPDIETIYKEGELVYPDSYNSDIREECTHGIHFFLTKKEAEAW